MHFKGEKKEEITVQNFTFICFDKLEMIVVKSKIVVTNVQKPVHLHLKMCTNTFEKCVATPY